MRILRSRDFTEFGDCIRTSLAKFSGTAGERLWKLAEVQPVAPVKAKRQWQPQRRATLSDLPALKSWPREKHPYFTLPLVISRHPETGRQNLGICRVQIRDERSAAINIRPGTGIGEHLKAAATRGQALPIGLVFGSDLALYWLAAAPLPAGIHEYELLNAFWGEKPAVVEGLTINLWLPADAEFVVEGEIRPGVVCQEGPFGNHSGSYVFRQDCPLFEARSISWREAPIMPFTVVGPPPSENTYLGRANEILIREILRIDYPEILALHMPESTLFHGVALLQVAPIGANGIRELIEQLWTESPLRKSRLLVLIDADIPPTDGDSVYWRLVNQLAGRRIYQSNDRVAIDATGVDLEQLVVEDAATAALIRQRSREYDR